MKLWIHSLYFIFAFGTSVQALPLPPMNSAALNFPQTFTEDFNFEGIVALSNCSGSLVRFENSKASDHAMVLTNGHCVNFMEAGEIILHQPKVRGFSLFDTSGSTVGRLTSTEIIYATMTKTDMALYLLEETYDQISVEHNVRPLTIASTRQEIGQAIEVISGYWERGYRCNVEAHVHSMREDEWTWNESIRYSRPGCEVIGGTSGSPVIAAGTRTIVGVNNTTNEDGERCTMNNPCEVDENGNVTYTEGYSYGQQTYWIYSCLNANNELDLNINGCQLHH